MLFFAFDATGLSIAFHTVAIQLCHSITNSGLVSTPWSKKTKTPLLGMDGVPIFAF